MLTKTSILFAVASSLLIVQATSAYEIKPCITYGAGIISAEVHNCPDKTAEYCEIGVNDTVSWDVKYITGTSYENDAETGLAYDSVIFGLKDQCKEQPGFCPGERGEEREHHFEFKIDGSKVPQTGIVENLALFTRASESNSRQKLIHCIELPVKFIVG